MALAPLLTAELFKEVALGLLSRKRDIECFPDRLRSSAATLRKIAEIAPLHADTTDERLMSVVDAVMYRFYPDHGRWDDPALAEMFEGKARLLGRVAGGEPVGLDETDQLIEFAKEMWADLSLFERQRDRQR